MSALTKVIRSGVGRRRLQSLVMAMTTMMAVTASLLAAGLLTASQAPFDHAFASQRGAHLTARFDGTMVTGGQLSATAHLSGVTAAAGPYPALVLRPRFGANKSQLPVGYQTPPAVFVGRAGPGGPVDDLIITSGTWANGPGQVVVNEQMAIAGLGDQLTLPDAPGSPVLTVVGLARSVGRSADAWVSPAQLPALAKAGTVPDQQMLYRFASAATDQQLAADRDEVASSMPSGSLTSADSYLTIKLAADKSSATYVPFLVSFGILGLCMSVLIIGVVVSGAVSSASRRIGILKAVGFTPEQVVRAYLGLALAPSTVGTVLGLLLGNLAAIPILNRADEAQVVGSTTIAPWLDVVVALVALTAVAGAALPPALRAGRLRTTQALTVGRTPSGGRGRRARQVLGRLPLSRPAILGLAGPFAKPGRSAAMVAAVVLGATGVTFGAGLAVSLSAVQDGLHRKSPGAVQVNPVPPPDTSMPGMTHKPDIANVPAIEALITAQPGTRRMFSFGQTSVSVVGRAGETSVLAYRGDYSWGAYQMVSGRWFRGPGEAVVPSGFLTATRTHLGDTLTLANDNHRTQVRIVGEAFSTQESGMVIMTDESSLNGLSAKPLPESIEIDIDLNPGTNRQAYLDSLTQTLAPYGVPAVPGSTGLSGVVVSMDALALMLTLMVVAVAGLGVLNTVLLDTRERVHDLGVFRALGMSPRQTVTMVLWSVSGLGLVAGLIGVPIGIALHDYVLPAMGTAAGTRIPHADLAVYQPAVLVPLLLGGLAIAIAGAVLPAGWAARTSTAGALRTE
ncbi:FtsX-like permease family protein [Kitasatospora sp. RB6PN24]|uniref:ABC transporter permease n=1 Tax=Kitasatospora humi TaxID=2893891 RepID=UPI001E3D2EE2|nr:FtsX-like permease family protein [Kitasatospora humi]MCC9309469.1 FtsX-like permease family protein [Kitasatospora humi]